MAIQKLTEAQRRVMKWLGHGWTIGDKSEKSLKMRKRERDDAGRYVVTHNVKGEALQGMENDHEGTFGGIKQTDLPME